MKKINYLAKIVNQLVAVLTVTFNPSIDRGYLIDKNKVKNHEVRIGKKSTSISPGGGGINVSKVLTIFGVKSTATGFLGGYTGQLIIHLLNKLGIKTDFVAIKGESRTCVSEKLSNRKNPFQVLEEGPGITKREQQKFLANYAKLLKKTDYVVLTGSIPPALKLFSYSDLIRMAKQADKMVFLDTNTTLLAKSLLAGPHVIKPNESEFKDLCQKLGLGNMKMVDAAQEIRKKYSIETIIITLGGRGALYVMPEGVYQVIQPPLDPISIVGCGDSVLAGYITGIILGLPVEERLKIANAAGAANAMNAKVGYFTKKDFAYFMRKIEVVKKS